MVTNIGWLCSLQCEYISDISFSYQGVTTKPFSFKSSFASFEISATFNPVRSKPFFSAAYAIEML